MGFFGLQLKINKLMIRLNQFQDIGQLVSGTTSIDFPGDSRSTLNNVSSVLKLKQVQE